MEHPHTKPKRTSSRSLKAASADKPAHYALRLFVTGVTPNSTRAIANLKAVCEKYFPDHYKLEIVDLYQQPELSKGEQLVVAPTLVKLSPLPERRLVGDLSDEERLLAGLDCPK